jgi:hypothetical protein
LKKKIVTANDKMQRGYRYVLSAPIGRMVHWAYDSRKI